MRIEIKQEGAEYSVYVDGVRMVDRESCIVADNITHQLQTGSRDLTEASEVAQSIVESFKLPLG